MLSLIAIAELNVLCNSPKKKSIFVFLLTSCFHKFHSHSCLTQTKYILSTQGKGEEITALQKTKTK